MRGISQQRGAMDKSRLSAGHSTHQPYSDPTTYSPISRQSNALFLLPRNITQKYWPSSAATIIYRYLYGLSRHQPNSCPTTYYPIPRWSNSLFLQPRNKYNSTPILTPRRRQYQGGEKALVFFQCHEVQLNTSAATITYTLYQCGSQIIFPQGSLGRNKYLHSPFTFLNDLQSETFKIFFFLLLITIFLYSIKQ